jgi:hypothetical protein
MDSLIKIKKIDIEKNENENILKKSISQRDYNFDQLSKNLLNNNKNIQKKGKNIIKKISNMINTKRMIHNERTNNSFNNTTRNFLNSINNIVLKSKNKNHSQRNINIKKFSKLNIDNKTGRLLHINKKKEKNSSKMTLFERMCNDIDKIKKRVDITRYLLKKNSSNYLYLKNLSKENLKLSKNEEIRGKNDETKNENEEDIQNEKKFATINNKEYNISKIPIISLSTISTNSHFTCMPLNKSNISINHNNKLFHERKFNISEKDILKKTYSIYHTPSFIKNSMYKIHDINIQMANISDKINLLLDNLSYFKTKYMYNGIFLKTFDNLDGILKAEFNINIEETCFIIVKIIPILLSKFYDSLEQILYIPIPDFEEEIKKHYKSEKDCLNLNYKFLINVSNYFIGCSEVFKVLKKKIDGYKFSIKDYINLNIYLDLARYNTSSLITFSQNFIDKIENDTKLLNKFEENVKIKKKEYNKEKEDDVERYIKRQKKLIFSDNLKIKRINNALSTQNHFFSDDINENNNNSNGSNKNKSKNQESIINSKLMSSVLKYIDISKRKQIIAQRIIDRFKENQLERMKEEEN